MEKGRRMETPIKKRMPIWATAILAIALLITPACSTNTSAAIPPPPPDVRVATVEQRDVPISREWIGTLDGMVNAAIRAQVSGYLLSQNYSEGSFVRKGQLLFEIDPRPLEAALDQAQGDLAKSEGQVAQANGQLSQSQAQLAQAEANQGKTQMDVDRFTPLVKSSVISQQDFDTAVQANLAAKAQVKAAGAGVESAKAAVVAAKSVVESNRASVRTAELNLSFTRITSPIDGIAGIAQAQVGNLIQ